MKITDKELLEIIQEEYNLELKRRTLKKKLNEVSNKLSGLNEGINAPSNPGYDQNLPIGIEDPAADIDEIIINDYELVNGNSDIEVYVNGHIPVTIDGDSFVNFYETKTNKTFPSIMTVDEVLMSFKNTKKDISELLLDFINENNIALEPAGE